MRKLISLFLLACLLFAFSACGTSEGTDPSSQSSGGESVSTNTDSSSVSSEPKKKLTAAEVLASDDHLVGLCDQVNGRIIVCDLAEGDWSDDNAVAWEYKTPYNNHIAGIKFRHSEYWGGDVVIFCYPGGGEILSYDTKKSLYKTSDIGWNPHSVELLPDGTFIVASSTDNLVCVFAPGAKDAHQKLEFPNAHGVLWDPKYEVVWMVGMDQLSAYRLIRSGEKVTLVADPDMDYRSPQAGMHDLAPVYGDPDSLFVTCSAGIMRFDKVKEVFDYGYSGGSMGRNVTYAPGVGNFANGILVYTSVVSGQTVYQDWCTNQVHVYVPLGGGRGKKLTLRAPNDAYYKVRVWNTDYQ